MEGAHTALSGMDVAWRLGATMFFVLLNGFFVAAEFSLVKLRPSRVEALVAQGNRQAAILGHMLGHLDHYLSACQLGITLASLILGALGEPAVSVLIVAAADGLGFGGIENASWLPVVSIGLAFAVITLLHMTVGEQAPKMWALERPEGVGLRAARTLRAFAWLLGPFISIVNRVSNGMLRLAGLPPGHDHDAAHSAQDIRAILALSARKGNITEREYELTENVFRMIQLEVRHIIVPRVEVAFLVQSQPIETSLSQIQHSAHSRLPLCEVGLDSIVGIIHARDVLDSVLAGRDVDLAALAHETIYVPDTMSLSGFLEELQSKQAHCAAVVDERGTVIGLAFREDALEQIVGPLGDEFDEQDGEFRELSDGRFDVMGRLSLPEFCDHLDFELPDDEDESEDTIGGHVTARLNRLPRKGDRVDVGPYQATVEEVGPGRVERLRITLRPTTSAEPEETEPEPIDQK